MIDPKTIASIIAAITALVGGSIAVEDRYVDEPTYARHVAENERGFILDLVGKASAVEPGAYKDTLCRSLEEALGRLCDVAPDDSICMDREAFREQAGC